jgi:osmotically-inducible protein OsmY
VDHDSKRPRHKEIEMLRTGHLLTVVLVASANLAGCATQPKCGSGECASDAKITHNVEAQLNRYPDLGPPNLISVETRHHVVYLSGSVSAGEQRETAVSLVAGMAGVERVVDTIYVAK